MDPLRSSGCSGSSRSELAKAACELFDALRTLGPAPHSHGVHASSNPGTRLLNLHKACLGSLWFQGLGRRAAPHTPGQCTSSLVCRRLQGGSARERVRTRDRDTEREREGGREGGRERERGRARERERQTDGDTERQRETESDLRFMWSEGICEQNLYGMPCLQPTGFQPSALVS